MKRVMVDMSCTLLHHGHIRLLRRAADFGEVIVALTVDAEILRKKGYTPELSFDERKEILLAIKYVTDVVPSKWLITDNFIKDNRIDILVHGDDNQNKLNQCELKIFERTKNISSEIMRLRAYNILQDKKNNDSTFENIFR